MDYRYFPDPDLLPLEISDEWIERVRGEMPELPHQLCERLQSEFGLPQYDASMLTASRDIADYYVALAAQGLRPQDGRQLGHGANSPPPSTASRA